MDAARVLDTLTARSGALRPLSPLDQAEQARELVEVARHVRQAAIYDATRTATATAVADALGVSVKAVEKAVAEHRKRMAADPSAGRRHPAGRRRPDAAIPAQRQAPSNC